MFRDLGIVQFSPTLREMSFLVQVSFDFDSYQLIFM